MKRLLLLLILSNFYLIQVKAQEVEIGLKAGMNVSTLGRAELGFMSRVAYHIGGTAEFITTPFFSLQTELMYSLQGAAVDRSQNIYLNYHYLNIPLLAKAYFYEDASFEIGVQYGRLIEAVNENYLGSQQDQINKNDFAVAFGLAYKLNEKINFGIRYNLGISNTADRNIIYEQRHTNRVLQISIGYIF
ncbi:MAG: PorT family protein [Cytophagales bacterium]|nr:PorT family protein [Cytophagales bacterium]